jgi:NADH-quinone oxidoreductase subunit E
MAPSTTEHAELPQELLDHIEHWREKPGNLIMVLHKVQEYYGYVPREVSLELSRLLEIPLAKIYGVITFYHYFKQKAPGRNRISVCMGTACYLKGNDEVTEELQNLLGVEEQEVTEDGEFSFEAVRCVGCCGLAPVVTVNDEVYGKVTKERLPEILAKHRDM